MDRRELLGVLGATAAGLAIAGGARAARAGHDKEDIHEKCADACSDCEKECNQAFHHCYKQVASGKAGHAKAMHLCVDCGEVCSTAAKLVARMSPLMVHTCRRAECRDGLLCRVREAERPRDEGGPRFAQEVRRDLPRDGQGDGWSGARSLTSTRRIVLPESSRWHACLKGRGGFVRRTSPPRIGGNCPEE